MIEPPVKLGAVKLSVTAFRPTLAMLSTGAPGSNTEVELTGVTLTPAEEGPLPTLLIASTAQEYAMPFVSPVTVMGEAVARATLVPQAAK